MLMYQVTTATRRVVDTRYTLSYQPAVIDVPIKPLNEFLDVDVAEEVCLYSSIDQLAQDFVSKALAGNPAIGTEVRRFCAPLPAQY